MRAPLGWLREYAELPAGMTGRELAEVLIRAGLEVETVDAVGQEISGPLVVGRILRYVDEPQSNGKTIRWVQVDVGPAHNQSHPDFPDGCREVVCGAFNFEVGDLVVVSLPGTTLAGGFRIEPRKTYGHVSDGMICAEDELGIGHDHTGIIVLPPTDDRGRALRPGDDPTGVLYLRDDVLDIDVSPDLGYCLSIRGLAREAAQALGLPFRDVVSLPTPAPRADGYPVMLSDPGCPLFVAVRVSGVDPHRPTPRWMARRLAMSGMRSISLPVDITNYVMLETGQPLHGYDAGALRGPIVVRKAAPGETIVTLDGQERALDPADLLITDNSGPIGMAGVMGGETTEMTAATTDVLIEAANFSHRSIGWTLRRHNLPSEASKRFHRGVDPAAAYSAAQRAARLFAQLCGGQVDPAETVAGAVPAMRSQTIGPDLPARILGVDVPEERVVEIMQASGVGVRKVYPTAQPMADLAAPVSPAADQGWDGGRSQPALGLGAGKSKASHSLQLTPPTWRPDLVDPYDYVEEVGRKLGFGLIPSVVPPAPVGRGYTPRQRARRALRQAAVGAGFVEVITFPFVGAEDRERMDLSADDPRRALVRLANPLAETAPYLRTTLLPGLFGAVARNTSRGFDDLALVEFGSVFLAGSGRPAPLPDVSHRPSDDELAQVAAAIPAQPYHVAAILTGAWRPAGWRSAAEPADVSHAFAFADAVAAAVGATIVRRPASEAPWHPGRCAALVGDGVVVGHAGEIHPLVCQAFGLPARTCAVEIDADLLVSAAAQRGEIAVMSTRPVAKEDVALLVDAAVLAADVEAALRAGAGELLESIRLFDVFSGGQVPAGKKSLAYALRFRASDRTLTDAETAAAKQAAVDEAGRRCGAQLRGF